MKSKTLKCPKCGSSKRIYEECAGFSESSEHKFFCLLCKCSFDDDPDEGGDYSTDPTRRIEYQEDQKSRLDPLS